MTCVLTSMVHGPVKMVIFTETHWGGLVEH